MRRNLPVTDHEILVPTDRKLISSTDLQGNITHCNDVFVKVSGYTRDELIGQPHNLIRHPDMPVEAFQVLWDTLKKGDPWMGLVKNRTKTGDYYWVSAYVTPITENGQVIGYESVRTCPDRKDVERAEKLYKVVRDKGVKIPGPKLINPWSIFILGALLSIAAVVAGQPLVGTALMALAGLGGIGFGSRRRSKMIRELDALMGNAFRHPVAALSYTDDDLVLGQLKTGILSMKAHLDTILTRIADEAALVDQQSQIGLETSETASREMRNQQAETDQVAAAMHEMTATIGEVSQHVQLTAARSEEANDIAENGRKIAVTTRVSIETLRDTVTNISGSVEELAGEISRIADAAQIIEQIADQTNLLALNAAIEAARAGEYGRGFAVVSDEVRELAKRTQESTRDIHAIIQELTAKARASVEIAQNGQQDAEAGLNQVRETEDSLSSISEAVGSIANMAIQMAAAVEEQAHVSEDINRQVVNISQLADHSMEKASDTAESIKVLQGIARQLHELVGRFSR